MACRVKWLRNRDIRRLNFFEDAHILKLFKSKPTSWVLSKLTKNNFSDDIGKVSAWKDELCEVHNATSFSANGALVSDQNQYYPLLAHLFRQH